MNSPPPEVIKAKVAEIAEQLKEKNEDALAQISRAVECLGVEKIEAILEETLELEAGEGMLVRDQSRRRTPGGVFLYLVKQAASTKDRRYIWPRKKPQEPPKVNWEDRLELLPEIIPHPGEVRTVKITLIGRPGRIVEKGNVILTTMKNRKAPPLPRGLPEPPQNETTYVVYIARKQWRRVSQAIKDPEDVLIVEGYPVFDQRLKAMAVFAIHTTTKQLQAARRDAQRQQARDEDE